LHNQPSLFLVKAEKGKGAGNSQSAEGPAGKAMDCLFEIFCEILKLMGWRSGYSGFTYAYNLDLKFTKGFC